MCFFLMDGMLACAGVAQCLECVLSNFCSNSSCKGLVALGSRCSASAGVSHLFGRCLRVRSPITDGCTRIAQCADSDTVRDAVRLIDGDIYMTHGCCVASIGDALL